MPRSDTGIVVIGDARKGEAGDIVAKLKQVEAGIVWICTLDNHVATGGTYIVGGQRIDSYELAPIVSTIIV